MVVFHDRTASLVAIQPEFSEENLTAQAVAHLLGGV
jgi:hypothetical protein